MNNKKPLIVAIALAQVGCSTIMTGSKQSVSFDSEPRGATVRMDGRVLGETPFTATLERKDDQTLTFELKGYRTATKDMTTKIDPWFFGNVIIGGVFGSTTDYAAGSIYEYEPNQYYVDLKPEEDSTTSGSLYNDETDVIVSFIVKKFRPLSEDISRGDGVYVKTLLGLLKINHETKNLDELKKILIDSNYESTKFSKELKTRYIF